MRIATWNVNSVKAREARVLAWLAEHKPDVLCLQELKTTDEAFPRESIAEAGYEAAVYGQQTYNGVALITRGPMEGVTRGLGKGDEQARVIEGTWGGVTVLSAYFPNGKAVGSDSFTYKLNWMRQLLTYLEEHHTPEDPVVLAGDFNVAIDELDANHPERWSESVLCDSAARKALSDLRDWGFEDVFRKHNPDGGVYTWWDYRRLAFPKNDGLRIDHIYGTKVVAETSTGAFVDRNQRKGKKTDIPSDHAPVVADFDWPPV
ncbi:MAG: exodeoxyribonuclease III [Longimicrobiales bacterium]